jgi:hypothetical protein
VLVAAADGGTGKRRVGARFRYGSRCRDGAICATAARRGEVRTTRLRQSHCLEIERFLAVLGKKEKHTLRCPPFGLERNKIPIMVPCHAKTTLNAGKVQPRAAVTAPAASSRAIPCRQRSTARQLMRLILDLICTPLSLARKAMRCFRCVTHRELNLGVLPYSSSRSSVVSLWQHRRVAHGS